MDFMGMVNFAMNTDLTDIDLNLPDELVETVRVAFMAYINAITAVLTHLYGENPTTEQIQEGSIIAAMAFRKSLGI